MRYRARIPIRSSPVDADDRLRTLLRGVCVGICILGVCIVFGAHAHGLHVHEPENNADWTCRSVA